MFGKLTIIGCGLIGSSILRAIQEKKLATKISVYDNSNKVLEYLKKNKIKTLLGGNIGTPILSLKPKKKYIFDY